MTLRIGFAYNQRSAAATADRTDDRFVEWEDAETIDAVEAALQRVGQVIRLEATEEFPERLRRARPDIVFNIAEGLHGPNRESHVPAICEFFDIPYTGSDPFTLSLTLDKQRTKEVLRARGVRTANSVVIGAAGESGTRSEMRFPVIVKPLYEGSSKGIPLAAVCHRWEEAEQRAGEVVTQYRQPALVEEFLPGREFSVPIMGNGADAVVLPIVEITFDALPAGALPIYGYEAKWTWDTFDNPLDIFTCPAKVNKTLAKDLEQATRETFAALDCRDWSRVDLRLDENGTVHVLEINALPGIHPDPRYHSFFMASARVAGLAYADVICRVLGHAMKRYRMHS